MNRNLYSILVFISSFAMGMAAVALADDTQSGGLKRIVAVNDTGQERTVQFDLLGVERCMFGDLDLVLLDFRHSQDKLRLQLTVESLDGNGKEIFYGTPLEQKTSKTNLGTFEVRLPVAEKGKMYGVFLCSVAAEKWGEEPCSAQPFQKFQSMMANYKPDMGDPKDPSRALKPYSFSAEVKPKNYYAHILVSTPSSLAVIENSTSPNNESLLHDFGLDKDTVTSGLSSLSNLTSTVASLPLESANSRLQIPLPYYSSQKCGGGEG